MVQLAIIGMIWSSLVAIGPNGATLVESGPELIHVCSCLLTALFDSEKDDILT